MQPVDNTIADVVELDKYRRLVNNVNRIRYLARYEIFNFTPAEYMVFSVLLTHTALVGKNALTIPLSYLTEGVEGPEGEVLQAPVPMSKMTLLKALRGLAANGWIEVRKNGRKQDCGTTSGANTYVVNLQAIDDAVRMLTKDLTIELEYSPDGLYPLSPTGAEGT